MQASKFDIFKALAANYQIFKANPGLNLFFIKYLNKFKPVKTGKHIIVHSHLPPLNSKAYGRFIKEHLLAKSSRPSHAQIAITNACPQNCQYCYNKDRTGQVMDSKMIIKLVQDLKRMGVFWLGLTGGEPLLNKHLLQIVEAIGDDCASKLFTTGCNLSPALASDLQDAGLNYVSVSLDHWQAEYHDRMRGYPGAFATALQAIDTFKKCQNIHVGVSAVLSRQMIQNQQVEEFLEFLIGLEVQEAWLSEAKPSIQAFARPEFVISEAERLQLISLQDKYNKDGKITVNYLGHFEGKECFGCNAGHKMVYIDAFGETSPCVFIPMTFGNVRDQSIAEIFLLMQHYFPSESQCFINKNYRHFSGKLLPVQRAESIEILKNIQFAPYAKFFQLYYKRQGAM